MSSPHLMKQELEVLKFLPDNFQLAFAYLTCERLFPNYTYFSKTYHVGDQEALREGINYLRHYLLTADFDIEWIQNILKNVDEQTPYPHDHESILASSALDACSAVTESLNFLIGKNFSRIESISTFATDTVDMYVQDILDLDYENPNFENIIQNHPLMVKEKDVQRYIINYLSSIKTLTNQDIIQLLDNQPKNGNIGLAV